MRVVLGERVNDERRADVSERSDLPVWPSDDCQATENRDTNPTIGELEPLSDHLTRERLISLDGGSMSLVTMSTLVLSTFIAS
jgi:hypothetical protein